MDDSKAENNKGIVLEAFDTLFNKRDYTAAERFVIPDFAEVRGARHSGKDPETTTRAPSRTNARALARPMPVSAPVISTVELFMSRAYLAKRKSSCGVLLILAGFCASYTGRLGTRIVNKSGPPLRMSNTR